MVFLFYGVFAIHNLYLFIHQILLPCLQVFFLFNRAHVNLYKSILIIKR